MKSAGFKDKGKGFPKNIFSLLKVGRRRRQLRLKKNSEFLIKYVKKCINHLNEKQKLCLFFGLWLLNGVSLPYKEKTVKTIFLSSLK
jgi:hypothetical protein